MPEFACRPRYVFQKETTGVPPLAKTFTLQQASPTPTSLPLVYEG